MLRPCFRVENLLLIISYCRSRMGRGPDGYAASEHGKHRCQLRQMIGVTRVVRIAAREVKFVGKIVTLY